MSFALALARLQNPRPSSSPADRPVRRAGSKARALKHLTVRLVGRYDIGWTDSTPYESGICLERTVSLLKEGEEVQLERGEHTFEVSRTHPRCQFCRDDHSG